MTISDLKGWFFNKNGYCQNVEECLYRHIDPLSKMGVCPWYERGFCPLGPDCSQRHVKGKRICQMYLTGFCPLGRECSDAQYDFVIFKADAVLNTKSQMNHLRANHRIPMKNSLEVF